MGRKSAVAKLPGAILQQLQARMVESAFSDFAGHGVWLKENGHVISKSAIHSYAKKMREFDNGSADSEANSESSDLRMRCVEVAVIIEPRIDLIGTASDLYFWVTTGRQA